MIVTTTPTVEGHCVSRYCGIVAGEAVLGKYGFKEMFGGSALVEGRERALQNAREQAINKMLARAEAVGANAVVGVDLDYEVLNERDGLLMVSASGTAVVIAPIG